MLEDLNKLALEAKRRSDDYDKKEFIFSIEFKSKFKELLPYYNITFYNYTSVVSTATNLLIIVPNQWFVIASFFNRYISALKIYKDKVNELRIDKATINSIRDNKIIDSETENKIIKEFQDNTTADRFRRFLTDYEWWFGSKTIDRTDYYVSSILSLASVINNSQSYIADLAYTLSEHQELNDLLQKDYELYLKQSIIDINEVETYLIEDKFLRNIIFESFRYVLNEYGEETVFRGHEIKDSIIEDRKYKGLTIPVFFGFEIIFAIFDKPLEISKLKSSNTKRYFEEAITILDNEYSYFTTQWNSDSRGLSLLNFNKYLASITNNNLEIIKDDNLFRLISKGKDNNSSPLQKTEQIIYYGAPGTGKSHKVNEVLKILSSQFYERITFHPEFDHASFVGGYRPISKDVMYTDKDDEEYTEHEVHYEFVPQAFTNIYSKAWNDLDNQYYLAIEEINRGNCAEIFGDIFQLLDRNSNYTVSPSNELKEHLNKVLTNKDGIRNGLKLPPNLSILATMNTSDQSLFPMDSAFKRRWDWEYIPICYDDIPENESFGYKVIIDDSNTFEWINFIKNVNAVIKTNPNLGMDKCIGNYFIKSDSKEITLKEFVNKAIFYLWNDVFKDEDNSDSIFEKGTSYEDFFPIKTNGKTEILKVLKAVNIEPTIV
ncbi:AAA family ATPase [Flavobacterium sp.]|jgi:hypothetical protein|uniref:AAA family ATPase n=1 Tax=Flavobacterium sp. TaxID=239 RepID=UPI0037C1811A